MKSRGAAEGNVGKERSAQDPEAGRNTGSKIVGAASAASPRGETTGQGTGLIEQVIARENLNLARKKVRRNKGAAGVDGLDIETTMILTSVWIPGVSDPGYKGGFQSCF